MSTSIMDLVAVAKATVPAISPNELKSLIGQEGILVVDVRDHPEVIETGKIEGALHVTRGMLEFRADEATPYHDAAFTKDKMIILYCASGGRSALAGKALMDLGFHEVRNLGGFSGWLEVNGPTEPAQQGRQQLDGNRQTKVPSQSVNSDLISKQRNRNMNRELKDRLLQIALVAFGAIFFLIYPMGMIWPSGWVWHSGEGQYYLQMICGVYAVLGAYLINAARNPSKHLSLISFTVWSSIVHAAIMAVQALNDQREVGHLVGDVPALLLVAAVLWYLTPNEEETPATA